MKDHLKSFFTGAALFMLIAPVSARITLPAFFTDNMVVQQNSMLTLEGKAKPQRTVTVVASWNKQKYTVKSQADGSFRLEIPTPVAGGPYTLTLSDGEKLILDNVMSGEVWFCSGQSNMQMPVAQWGGVMNYEQETAEAQYPSVCCRSRGGSDILLLRMWRSSVAVGRNAVRLLLRTFLLWLISMPVSYGRI